MGRFSLLGLRDRLFGPKPRTYAETVDELGGAPWRRLDGTERWFLADDPRPATPRPITMDTAAFQIRPVGLSGRALLLALGPGGLAVALLATVMSRSPAAAPALVPVAAPAVAPAPVAAPPPRAPVAAAPSLAAATTTAPVAPTAPGAATAPNAIAASPHHRRKAHKKKRHKKSRRRNPAEPVEAVSDPND